MSWGEGSCLKPCRCPEKYDLNACNVDCPEYVWDGQMETDGLDNFSLEDNFHSPAFWDNLRRRKQ